MSEGISFGVRIAEEIINEFNGVFISRRDGFVIVKIPIDNETVIVWVRHSPITYNALKIFDKIISKHAYDKAILLNLAMTADYVKFSDLEKRFNKIYRSIEEFRRNI